MFSPESALAGSQWFELKADARVLLFGNGEMRVLRPKERFTATLSMLDVVIFERVDVFREEYDVTVGFDRFCNPSPLWTAIIA